MSFGYVHPISVPPPTLAVGFLDSVDNPGQAQQSFPAPDCGGEDVETIDVYVVAAEGASGSVRVQSVAGGHYTSGVDFQPVDETIEFPGEEWQNGLTRVLVQVVVDNALAGCPLPNEYDNPAIVLELSEATGVEIGGEAETLSGTRELLGIVHLISTGI
jgi:hypothetical protein